MGPVSYTHLDVYKRQVEGIALVAGVDRVLDMMRTVVNITGDQSAAVCVNALENRKETRQAAKAAA